LAYSALEYAYTRFKGRVILKLPLGLSPTQAMVLPLMAKDGLPEIALEIREALAARGLDADYDDAGTIGRRYARADEIGVPLSITVDYKTKEDHTVTVRDRDTWSQVRSDWRTLPEEVVQYMRGAKTFLDLGTPVEVTYE